MDENDQKLMDALKKADALAQQGDAQAKQDATALAQELKRRQAARQQAAQQEPDLATEEPVQQPDNSLPARFARGAKKLGRGAERIVTGDVSLQEGGEAIETSVRSMSAPLGGDAVAGGAAEIVQGLPNVRKIISGNAAEATNQVAPQRERRRQLAEASPMQAAASEALGFGGVQAILTKMAPALLVSKTGGTLGSKAKNAGKMAADGFVVGATGATAQTGDPVKGIKTGAVDAIVAPGFSGSTRLLGDVARNAPAFVKSVAGEPSEAAMRALAKRVKVDVDTVKASIDEFRRVNKRAPAVAEILDEESVVRLRAAASSRKEAAAVLNEAEELFAIQRPGQMQELLEGNTPAQSAKALVMRRNQAMTDAVRNAPEGQTPLADEPIAMGPLQDFLSDPDIISFGTRKNRRKLADAMDGETRLTVGLLEDLRYQLGQAGKGGGGEAADYRELAADLGELITEQNPKYGEVFARYKLQSQFIDGIDRGRTIKNGSTSDFEQLPEFKSNAEKQGAGVGARSALAEAAGEDAGTAVATAKALTGTGLRRRMDATLPEGEANRFADIGVVNSKAAENMTRLSPRTELPPSLKDSAENAAELALIISGQSSSFMDARAAANAVSALAEAGVPPGAAKKMAEMLVDPSQTEEVVAKLAEIGMEEEYIRGLLQNVSAVYAGSNEQVRPPELRGTQE